MFPFIGLVLYVFFGEVSVGEHTTDHYLSVQQSIYKAKPEFFDQGHDQEIVTNAASSYATSINGFPITSGNTVELLPDAAAARQRLIDDIDQAEREINLLYYIWLPDNTGLKTANALINAAKRGVTCRAMVDAMGSRLLLKHHIWQSMKEAGVQLTIALPYHPIFKTILLGRLDLRNHRKITVIDGAITYIGSQNCADPEFAIKAKYAPWVDILFRVQGPVVAQNQLLFMNDWLSYNNEPIDSFTLNQKEINKGFDGQIIGDGPTIRHASTQQLFSTILHQAKSSITISTPYFVPDEIVLGALCSAALRGIKVKMIFPKRNDSFIVAGASRSFYRTLLEAGVELYEFKGGLLHSKTLTVDDSMSFVGSSNMDIRSFDLNFENDFLIHDAETTRVIQTRQQEYLHSSDTVSLAQVMKWSLPKRIWNNLLATVGPIL